MFTINTIAFLLCYCEAMIKILGISFGYFSSVTIIKKILIILLSSEEDLVEFITK